jgi:hypothetical protein
MLFTLSLIAFTSTEVSDPDTWQHLASGRYIMQFHAFPAPDPFSFTTEKVAPTYPGEEKTRLFNITHERVAQILMYLVYANAGFAGLVLLRSALLVAFCGIIGMTAYQRTHSFYRGLAAAVLAATLIYDFRTDRPYLFTFVFLAATIAILEYRRWLWVLPAMFFLWANTHGGFIVGWVVLGLYCAEALFLRWRGKARPDEVRLWLIALASVLISGLNPTGFQVIPVMIAYRRSTLQTTLWEWQHPALWPPAPFSILLVFAAVLLVRARRQSRPVDWMLLLVFGAAAFTALRNIILAGVVAPLLIASYFPWKRRISVAVEYLIALLILAGTGVLILRGHSFQFHSADWKYPARAADFMLAHHITAPMFNTYEFGAYLIWRLWPQERVFIDGRAQSEKVYLDYQRIVYGVMRGPIQTDSVYQALRPQVIDGKSAEELLQEYGVDVILMDGFEYTSGSPYLLVAALLEPQKTEWSLVYQDAQALIYMRHPPAGVTPLNPMEALASMEAQCQEHLRHDSATPRCAAGLSDMFARIGDQARARRWRLIAAEYDSGQE